MDDSELRALLAAQSRLIAELSERLAPTVSTLTLRELYARYEASSKARRSWDTIMYLLRPTVREYGARPAASLRVTDWTTFRAAGEGKWSGSTLNQQLAWLKTLLRWGVDQGLLPVEPHLCRAKPAKVKIARETAPTEDDAAAMLALAGARMRVVVLCVFDAGMRRNEYRQLQRAWLDRERMEIRMPNWACKGSRGRTTQLTSRLLRAIDAIPRDIRSPYVLTNADTGEPFAAATYTKLWRALAADAGLQAVPGEVRVRGHDGRHGFATQAVCRGVRLEVVSDMLGHASLETTRIYVQRRGSDLAKAREDFERGIEKDRHR